MKKKWQLSYNITILEKNTYGQTFRAWKKMTTLQQYYNTRKNPVKHYAMTQVLLSSCINIPNFTKIQHTWSLEGQWLAVENFIWFFGKQYLYELMHTKCFESTFGPARFDSVPSVNNCWKFFWTCFRSVFTGIFNGNVYIIQLRLSPNVQVQPNLIC